MEASNTRAFSTGIFLDVLYTANLIKELTQEVLALSFPISQQLPKYFTLSLNISAEDLKNEQFIASVEKICSKYGCRIDFELTEQTFVEDAKASKNHMKRLHTQGVVFSIDDFGTGYSSLSYLKYLPLDFLKIDKSFVDDMLFDENDLAIVKSIIAVAKSLGLQTVAEGVETKAQFDLLCKLGCDYFQGYFFSKPLSVEEFTTRYLKKTESKTTKA